METVFEKNYKPHQKVAVDESMVKFKGRSSLKQYNINKPIKRGYKIWMLCDESGYNLKFQIYTGKLNNTVEVGLGSRVVLDLVQGLDNKNHLVYMDNYFSSYDLYTNLMSRNIYACGTVNINRVKLPKMVDDKSLQRGDYDYKVSNDNVSVVKWKDKKSVHLLSTFHDPKTTTSVNRKQKDGTIVEVSCPVVLKDYNQNMNFVDNFDRIVNDYHLDRKAKRWWMRIFFHFLHCSVSNAYICHKEIPNMTRVDNKEFIRQVYEGLLAKSIVEESPLALKRVKAKFVDDNTRKPYVSKHIRLEKSRHQPESSTSRRCVVCSTKRNPVRTIWSCNTCKVPLCVKKDKSCFQSYHSA
jgi:hypothetical protein